MPVSHVNERETRPVAAPGVRNVLKQIVVGPGDGWQGWVMRRFTLRDRGYTPRHRHPWPHVMYVLSGQGVFFLEGKEYAMEPGSFAFVPPDAEHQFTSTAPDDLIFLCIVPEEGDK